MKLKEQTEENSQKAGGEKGLWMEDKSRQGDVLKIGIQKERKRKGGKNM